MIEVFYLHKRDQIKFFIYTREIKISIRSNLLDVRTGRLHKPMSKFAYKTKSAKKMPAKQVRSSSDFIIIDILSIVAVCQKFKNRPWIFDF